MQNHKFGFINPADALKEVIFAFKSKHPYLILFYNSLSFVQNNHFEIANTKSYIKISRNSDTIYDYKKVYLSYMKTQVFLITPPFTQLNTPYPATAYIKGFLITKNISATQSDLGIEVILK